MNTKAIGDLDARQKKIDFAGKNPRDFFNQEERELNSFSKEKDNLSEEFQKLFPDKIWLAGGVVSYKEGKNRYSSEELSFFKKVVNKKLLELKFSSFEDYESQRHSDLNEKANEYSTKINNQKINNNINKKIFELNSTLSRIERGSYGICLKTGKLIHPKRLFLVPYALVRI